MAHISVRVPEEEKLEIEKYAKFCGCSVSQLVRKLFVEKMEDEEDIQAVNEYEKNKLDANFKTLSHEEVGRILGIG